MTDCINNLNSALELVRRGYSVIPVHSPVMPLSTGRVSDESGKFPLIPWSHFQQCPPTEEQIDDWWTRWPDANLGVVTGNVSGTIVLDVDGKEGIETLRVLSIPETCYSQTGSGRHYWFNHPGGIVPNFTRCLPGIDLRGDGGFVVVSPSVHRTGRRYTWLHSEGTPLANPPDWLVELILKPSQRSVAPESVHAGPINEGARNNTLYRLGRNLRHTGLSPGGIGAALQHENRERCEAPLPVEEVARLVEQVVTQPDRADFQPKPFRNSFPSSKGDVGKETNFAPVRADTLLSEPMGPMVWVWNPFIPEGGLVLFSAFMKVGKSTLLYPLALAVARGNPFLGYPTKQGGVLVLAVEEHPRDVRARLGKIGLTAADPIYVHRGTLTSGDCTLNAIRTFIAEKQIVLVILDTLAKYWGIEDENNNAEVTRLCNPFLDLARGTECAILLTHHDRKSGGENGRSIRGGSALLGLVDQALMLDRRQGGAANQRVLRSTGRYAETPQEMVIEWNGNQYTKVGTSDELSDSALDERLLQTMDCQPRTVEELAARSGLPVKAVRKVLDRIPDKVTKEGSGVKGDPFKFRLSAEHSFHSQDHPYREETKHDESDGMVAP